MDSLEPEEASLLEHDWQFWARENQLPPEGEWFCWLILAGRGWGKTRAGAEWVIQRVREERGPVGLIGETAGDVRDLMVETGPSSILKISPPDFRPQYEPSKRKLTWPNGVTATTFSGDKPDQLRGPNLETAWADEPAKWQYAGEAWDNLEFALRSGNDPRVCATTTPRPISLIRDLVEDDQVEVTSGSTYENVENLADRFRDRLLSKYEGTRLGRQELHAELLTDVPGALWSWDGIEDYRDTDPPDMERIVIGVDPAGGGPDEVGIVVCGKSGGHGYVLDDRSMKGSPNAWASAVVSAFEVHEADRVVAEKNYGGDMVESTLRTARRNLPVEVITASRGKQQRAEPVAALYEQGRVHHVGSHPKLEDQMTTWDPSTSSDSPDRVDALVWALTNLMLGSDTTHHGRQVTL